MKIIFKCRCGCGAIVWEEGKKLWFESDTVARIRIRNMNNGYVNGKHTIMQPNGAAKVLKWLDAHPDQIDTMAF